MSCSLYTTAILSLKRMLGTILIVMTSSQLSAQQFGIDHQAISGGGGFSSSGKFGLAGTIGQPASGGTLSGGKFTLENGFWQLVTLLQTPGAPSLNLLQTGGNITITWAAGTSGFTLESTTSLDTPANWQVVTDVQNNSVTVTSGSGMKFFRLRKLP